MVLDVVRVGQRLHEHPTPFRGELDYRAITEWQGRLARELAPRTGRQHRQTLAQVVGEAVKMGALVGNPVRSVKPLRVTDAEPVALDRNETRALLDAARDHRLGAAVALLFLQGWRVSEVLGLAWEDLDLDAGPRSLAGRLLTSTAVASSSGRPRPSAPGASTG